MRCLAAEWRSANDPIRQVEPEAAGLAANPPVRELPNNRSKLADPVLADPVFQRLFRLLASTIGFVELDSPNGEARRRVRSSRGGRQAKASQAAEHPSAKGRSNILAAARESRLELLEPPADCESGQHLGEAGRVRHIVSSDVPEPFADSCHQAAL